MGDFIHEIKPSRNLRRLNEWIEEGEHTCQDFKYTVNDARKIARTLSAFANNMGGRLLIGVDDNGKIKGVNSEEDIFVVDEAASIYCTPEVHVEYSSFRDRNGATVVCAEVCDNHRQPYYVKETDNRLKAYFRSADENILADPLHVKALRFSNDTNKMLTISLSGEHTTILKMISEPCPVNKIMYHAPISKQRVEEMLIQLYDMGLITFAYIKSILYICPK